MMLLQLVLAIALAGTTATPVYAQAGQPELAIAVRLVASGFDRPVDFAVPADGSNRMFIVEQAGRIRVMRNGRLAEQPFLDLHGEVSCCGERGLLSMAFHPRFAETGWFFVSYTNTAGDTRAVRYQVTPPSADVADPASGQTILAVDQPAANHNGGLVLFGPDGYLYIGLGDGGGGNSDNGQDLGTLLGKILRIDVDHPASDLPYSIPPDNPFVTTPGARSEIWALGLRNPWRFSFDRATGDLWIGDVGSALYEEINFQPSGSQGGENYGWDLMEGTHCRHANGCDRLGLVLPVSGFDRNEGCVVTGGYVYRGHAIPHLAGTYLFADYCSGDVWGLRATNAGEWQRIGPVSTGLRIVSFAEDANGELYLVDLEGGIYQIVAS
jgi:glucose/arabinose dehydrogenase